MENTISCNDVEIDSVSSNDVENDSVSSNDVVEEPILLVSETTENTQVVTYNGVDYTILNTYPYYALVRKSAYTYCLYSDVEFKLHYENGNYKVATILSVNSVQRSANGDYTIIDSYVSTSTKCEHGYKLSASSYPIYIGGNVMLDSETQIDTDLPTVSDSDVSCGDVITGDYTEIFTMVNQTNIALNTLNCVTTSILFFIMFKWVEEKIKSIVRRIQK